MHNEIKMMRLHFTLICYICCGDDPFALDCLVVYLFYFFVRLLKMLWVDFCEIFGRIKCVCVVIVH